MPRSHLLPNRWRILLAALAVLLLLCTGFPADAQQKKKRKPARPQQTAANSNTATTNAQQQPTKKNLAALRTGDSPEGGRATITSDAPLSDYEAYRSGNRYYVVIPQANAPSVPAGVRGRGFDDVQVHKRGNDTVLSFRLKPGTTAHVNQKFNKLDVVFNSPADSSGGAQSGTASAPTGTSNTATGNANGSRTGTEATSGATRPPNAATSTGPNATTAASPSSGNTSVTVASPTATATPGTASLPPITPALGPTETPATAVASPTPPADQVAQAQPAPSAPTSAVTTTPVTSGTSLGAMLRSNWPLVLVAALLLIGIGLVVMNRSRARRGAAATRRPISDQETLALEEGAMETAEAAPGRTASVEGAVVAAGTAEGMTETEPVAAVMDETETIETEPVEALNVELVRREIKHVLTGEPYDESVINAPARETRQLIESELLFALSKRHTERRDRALKAFTEHGYFDDATRDLRTAVVPAERAAAARKLGLTRDTTSTPHLVAALEDTAPEVRRAAVEALTELHDSSAVAPLQSLLDREEDRKVPHALILRAIRASSVSPAEPEEKPVSTGVEEPLPAEEAATVEAAPVEAAPVEAAPVSAEEVATEAEEVATPVADVAVEPEAGVVVEESLVSAPESAASLVEDTPAIEAEPTAPAEVMEVAPAEAASDLSAGIIAPAIVEGIATAEAVAAERRRAEADAARIHAEQEAQRRTAEEAERQRAEEESLRRRVEEANRLRAEAEANRLAEETRQREEEERRRVEQERRRTEEEQRRAEEEQRRAEEERSRVEEEQRRAEEERRRVEAEAQRQREEEEAARLRAEEERQRAEERALRRDAEERERQEEEARQKAIEEERLRAEEARRLRTEERERRRAEEERSRIEAEERERGEADAARRRAEEAAMRLADMRRRMEEEARQREEAEAERLRAEEEARQREEEEAARLRAEEERQHAAEEAARLRAEEEEAAALHLEEQRRAEEAALLYAEEERARVEEEARQHAEAEAARIRYEQEAAARQEEAEAPRIELEEIEPGHVETTKTIVQSDLFEATFTELTPYAPPAETSTEATGIDWLEVDTGEQEAVRDIEPVSAAPIVVDETAITEYPGAEAVPVKVIEEYTAEAPVREVEVAATERGVERAEEDFTSVPGGVLRRLSSESAEERAAAVSDLSRVGGADAFREISAAFDDPSQQVRDSAARALFNLNDDHAASFTRALREAPPERRRKIGNALATSGLAGEAIGHLMGESREKTYDAFSLLFLMSKAGEVQPLMRAIEEHPNSEVRLAVVKLLALSGQQEILPAFRRLAVRGSLPTEVRSAVMEAIYQISSQASTDTTPVA